MVDRTLTWPWNIAKNIVAISLLMPLPLAGCKDSTPENRLTNISLNDDLKSAPPEPKPPLSLINRVEEQLMKHPCVGQMNKWDRAYSYAFDRSSRSANKAKIDFALREAGVYGFKVGRTITEPLAWLNIDDREYDFLYGHYIISKNRIVMENCTPIDDSTGT